MDAERLFAAAFEGNDHAYWLDTSTPPAATAVGESAGISVLGDASGPRSRVVTADVTAGTVTVRDRQGEHTVAGPFLDWLDADLRANRAEPVAGLPFDFALGWVGHLGYELKTECHEYRTQPQARPVHPAPTADATLVFADRAVVLDHRTGLVHLLTLSPLPAAAPPPAALPAPAVGSLPAGGPAHAGGSSAPTCPACAGGSSAPACPASGAGSSAAADRDDRDNQEWCDRMIALIRSLGAAPPLDPEPVGRALPVGLTGGQTVTLRHDRERYLGLIAAAQDAIRAGETYEVCLTNQLTVSAPLSPWPTYRALRHASPAPFGAYLAFGDLAVLSSSPERFLRVRADGTAESKPIKGTRPRGADPAEDAALRADLVAAEKDRAENLMIVDLVRNDLGRVAAAGSVRVPALFAVESYATVHQLVSTVTATLAPGRSAVDCVRAAFPGGSMTGAPKLRTMELLDELEAGPRGVYSGALGYFSLTGAADLAMVIRTLVITSERATYGVGGAITALSDPAAEYEETAVKTTGLLRVLGAEFPERNATV